MCVYLSICSTRSPYQRFSSLVYQALFDTMHTCHAVTGQCTAAMGYKTTQTMEHTGGI